ncbi:hypothetical protein [Desulfobacula sp.]|jgi:hypothetical protein|uniref:hypothetical protein n=1 Tax=Desulfobacula sp. TaxID=2593537 RepID=UPI0039B98525
MTEKFSILIFCILFLFMKNISFAEPVQVSDFSGSGLEGWEEKEFKNSTFYQVFQIGNKRVLLAKSRNTASALIKKVHIN